MFSNDSVPLINSEPPYGSESLTGYLLRMSERHQLRSPSQLLKLINGHQYKLPRSTHIMRMSELFNTHPNSISALFGIEFRTHDNQRAWCLQNNIMTKSYFTSTTYSKYCPLCLGEDKYLRDVWSLSLYQACPKHNISLTHSCPECGKLLKWFRPGISTCNCGADLLKAKQHPSSDFELLISSLILQKLHRKNRWPEFQCIDPVLLSNLTQLSLDGLFKTIWLLGSILHTERYQGKKTTQKNDKYISLILENTQYSLSDWPNNFYRSLDKYSTYTELSKSITRDIFGPIHRYIFEDMNRSEHRHLIALYEAYLRKLLLKLNKEIPLNLFYQRELDFTKNTHNTNRFKIA